MKERPTPETDAEFEGIRNSIKKEHQFDWAIEVARKLERERDELLQWKKETILVESQWDEQAVGRLLRLQLGDSIKPNIEPTLRQLIEARDEAQNKMADALQEVDLRTLDFERMKQERDEARKEAEYYKARYDVLKESW